MIHHQEQTREHSGKNYSFVAVDWNNNERELSTCSGNLDLLDSDPPEGANALAVIPMAYGCSYQILFFFRSLRQIPIQTRLSF